MPNPLSDTLTGLSDDASGLKYGTITATFPIMARVGAATLATECRCLDSYVPVLGDYVAVWVSGADRLILGAVAASNVALTPTVSEWRDGGDPGFFISGLKPGYTSTNRYSVHGTTVFWQGQVTISSLAGITGLGGGFGLQLLGWPVPPGQLAPVFQLVGSAMYQQTGSFGGDNYYWVLMPWAVDVVNGVFFFTHMSPVSFLNPGYVGQPTHGPFVNDTLYWNLTYELGYGLF